MHRVGIRGAGFFVPDRIVTNHDLARIVDTSHDWIIQKTGISERRFVSEDQSLSDLAIRAANAALLDAGLNGQDIDLIIVSSSTHDYVAGPLTSVIVKDAISAPQAITFDLNIICAGTNYSIEIARKFIQDGSSTNALIIGGESFSKLPNFFSNRTTAVIFGDGAGALILSRLATGRGILQSTLHSNLTDSKALYLPIGGSKKPWSAELFSDPNSQMHMDGKTVYTFAVSSFVSIIKELCAKENIQPNNIDFVFPHQANINIISEAMRTLDMPVSKTHPVLDRFGNIGGGSLIISFVEAKQTGRVKAGDVVAMLGFGSGLAWGGQLIELSSPGDFVSKKGEVN